MSLLQPHSSPDKAADYTTCSGKRIACVFACLFVCVCHLTQSGHLLIVCSQVKGAHFLINTFFHTPTTTEAQSLPHTDSLAYIHRRSHTRDHISRKHTYTHTLNQVWLSEQATQWEWVIRPSETRPDLSLHIKSSMRMCVFMSQWL